MKKVTKVHSGGPFDTPQECIVAMACYLEGVPVDEREVKRVTMPNGKVRSAVECSVAVPGAATGMPGIGVGDKFIVLEVDPPLAAVN